MKGAGTQIYLVERAHTADEGVQEIGVRTPPVLTAGGDWGWAVKPGRKKRPCSCWEWVWGEKEGSGAAWGGEGTR